jgi:DivIVA domain-containing protein
MGAQDDREIIPLGAGFDVVRRGYDRGQVDEHLERLDADLGILIADRDTAVSQTGQLTRKLEGTHAEVENLKAQVNRLSVPPTNMDSLSERLQRMLRLAQDEADEIRARAETDITETRKRHEVEAADLRSRYENLIAELDARRSEMESEHRSMMETARKQAANMIDDANQRRAKVDAEADARRIRVEEDFEIAMAARRTEAMRVLANQEAASKHESERRLREATEQAARQLKDAAEQADHKLREAAEVAERRVVEATKDANRRTSDATDRVNALRATRESIAERLRSVQNLLNNSDQVKTLLTDAAKARTRPEPAGKVAWRPSSEPTQPTASAEPGFAQQADQSGPTQTLPRPGGATRVATPTPHSVTEHLGASAERPEAGRTPVPAVATRQSARATPQSTVGSHPATAAANTAGSSKGTK